MQHILNIVILLVAMAFGNIAEEPGLSILPASDDDGIANIVDDTQSHTNGTVRSIGQDEDKSDSAIEQDTQILYRICNSRPSRLLPTSWNKNQRISFRTSHMLYKPANLISFSRKKAYASSAPSRRLVPGSQDVIALRHIIR